MLARTDLKTSQLKLENTQAQQFAANLTFSNPTLGTLRIPRGWISLNLKMRGKTYRFVNAHLESFSSIINYIQATELLQTAGDANLPLIFAGALQISVESPFR